MSNMLYDTESKAISGLVDFDWAAVTHPAHEFFFGSLHDLHGTPREQPKLLEQAILTGNFDENAEAREKEDPEAWELAKVWHQAMEGHEGLRPSDIGGMATLDKLNAFVDLLCPWQLNDLDMLKSQSPEHSSKARADAERAIDEMLQSWGAPMD